MQLGDGRVLSYFSCGEMGRRLWLFVHGTPGSAAQVGRIVRAADRAGVHLVAPDRPGCGESDPHLGGGLLDWPADVAALLDHLDALECNILSVSGGSPFALACASAIPERLGRVVIVSGIGPAEDGHRVSDKLSTRVVFNLAHRRPSILSLVLRPYAAFSRALAPIVQFVPEDTPTGVSGPQLAAEMRATFTGGVAGQVHDLALVASPWRLDLEGITTSVEFWHGALDHHTPVSGIRSLTKKLSRSRLRVFPEEDHFVLSRHAYEIFTSQDQI